MEIEEGADLTDNDVDLLLASACVDISRDHPDLAKVAEELYLDVSREQHHNHVQVEVPHKHETSGMNTSIICNDFAKTCVVCSASASGFRYFGAVVCNSCRAFFARANKNQAFQRFICVGRDGAMCQVESKSWRSCKKCRFAMCLAAKMDVAKAKFAKKKVQLDNGLETSIALAKQMEHKLTLADCSTIDAIVNSNQDFKLWQSGNFFIRDPATFACSMKLLFRGEPVPIKVHRDHNQHSVFLLQQLYRSESILNAPLNSRDRSVMVEANFDPCISLMLALAIKCHRYKQNSDHIAALMDPATLTAAMGGDADAILPFREIYLQESDGGRKPVAAFTFERAFPKELFAGNDKLENRVRDLVVTLNNSPKVLLADRSFPPLLVHLFLNSPDFLKLDQPKEALEMQAQITSLLYRYLKSKINRRPDQAASLLGRILSSIAVAREVGRIRRHLIQAKTL